MMEGLWASRCRASTWRRAAFKERVPIGPAALITACDGNLVRELDGPVDAVLGETIARVAQDASGNLMCGISVPTRAAALAGGGACTSDEGAHEYVVRAMLGYSKAQSILAVGDVAPSCSAHQGAPLQLHQFSADAARAEMRAGATTLKGEGTCGGFMVSCLGRGEPLYGKAGVDGRAQGGTWRQLLLSRASLREARWAQWARVHSFTHTRPP